MLVACEKHRLIYVTAAVTGLRRGELDQLQWGDVHLDISPAYIKARPSTTKNKKDGYLVITDELVSMLRHARPESPSLTDPVLRVQPKLRWLKRDLAATGIPYKNERGEQADLHSMRYLFCTQLALSGSSERVRQEAMRLSDAKLAAHVYTDVTQLPTTAAIAKLPKMLPPELAERYHQSHPQIDPQTPDFSGPDVSRTDADNEDQKKMKPPETKGESRDLAHAGAQGPSNENGSGSWIRTNDLVINSHPLYR
jgi:hypothetical protein